MPAGCACAWGCCCAGGASIAAPNPPKENPKSTSFGLRVLYIYSNSQISYAASRYQIFAKWGEGRVMRVRCSALPHLQPLFSIWMETLTLASVQDFNIRLVGKPYWNS